MSRLCSSDPPVKGFSPCRVHFFAWVPHAAFPEHVGMASGWPFSPSDTMLTMKGPLPHSAEVPPPCKGFSASFFSWQTGMREPLGFVFCFLFCVSLYNAPGPVLCTCWSPKGLLAGKGRLFNIAYGYFRRDIWRRQKSGKGIHWIQSL